jgi:hypothetical protein
VRIELDRSALKDARWHQFLIRFVLGGLITVATGIIGKKYGPVVGGLFLGFPAIFPASATLVEKLEQQKGQRAGLNRQTRARKLAAVDAAGTAIGSSGLFVFALLTAELISRVAPWVVITAAVLLWMVVSILFWYIRKRI